MSHTERFDRRKIRGETRDEFGEDLQLWNVNTIFPCEMQNTPRREKQMRKKEGQEIFEIRG